MKKLLSLLLVLMISLSMTVYANENTELTIIPVSASVLEVNYDGKLISYDTQPQIVDGKVMVPLRYTLEEMGYQVNWNKATFSVDLIKGAQFTSLYIGKNSYFKNKMAPIELSIEPKMIDGRTLIPIEFFYEILGIGFEYESGVINFEKINPEQDMEPMAVHVGFVEKIEVTSGSTKYQLSDVKGGEVSLIISTSKEYTIFQTEVAEGDFIHVLSLPMMLLSYPGQAGGIVIY